MAAAKRRHRRTNRKERYRIAARASLIEKVLLTDAQIDRYSRQIILPEVGGIGQERLLAARVRMLAEIGDLSPALEYLTGAGVGTISLDCPGDPGKVRDAIAALAQLNPDVRLQPAADGGREVMFVLAGSDRVVESARRINDAGAHDQTVFVRLGAPCRIAVLTSRPPCLACAAPGLLDPLQRGKSSTLIAMAAAAELVKHLLAAGGGSSRLVQFTGYESHAQELNTGQGCAVCKPEGGFNYNLHNG
jgi:hypothetical protein